MNPKITFKKYPYQECWRTLTKISEELSTCSCENSEFDSKTLIKKIPQQNSKIPQQHSVEVLYRIPNESKDSVKILIGNLKELSTWFRKNPKHYSVNDCQWHNMNLGASSSECRKKATTGLQQNCQIFSGGILNRILWESSTGLQ